MEGSDWLRVAQIAVSLVSPVSSLITALRRPAVPVERIREVEGAMLGLQRLIDAHGSAAAAAPIDGETTRQLAAGASRLITGLAGLASAALIEELPPPSTLAGDVGAGSPAPPAPLRRRPRQPKGPGSGRRRQA